MAEKKVRLFFSTLLILMSIFFITGCNSIPLLVGRVPTGRVVMEASPLTVTGPEIARDVSLDFIRENFRDIVPEGDLNWVGGEAPSVGDGSTSNFQYVSGSWVGGVSSSYIPPNSPIYTVKIRNVDSGFAWEGLVDAYNQVVTTSVAFNPQEETNDVIESDPTDSPVIGMLEFRDDVFKIAMEYPADWAITETQAGDGSNAKALRLQKGTWVLVIYYKFT
jgi:hypothetical protein